MSQINGVVIGIVTGVSDNGKVKVKFPWLPDDPETDWIRIATTMAGNGRGTFFMPEEKDEVLVAFEHGDTDYPYVVGFLWNGKDKPPENDKNVRRIKTKSGHTIEFNDNPGQEGIVIESQGGQKIEMKDNPVGSISLTASANISLNAPDITLSAPVNISLRTPNVSLGASGSSLVVNGSFSLEALGLLSITAPTIQVTGATAITGVTNIKGPTTIIGVSPLPTLTGSKLIIT